jgi:6-phosphogluconate dehydrogenase
MVAQKGLLYMGMGVSGGEEGARNGARGGPPAGSGWPASAGLN